MKPEKARKTKQGLWRPLLLVVIVIVIFVLALKLNLGARLGELQTWIKSLGTLGPVVFILIYVVATVLSIPGSVITIAPMLILYFLAQKSFTEGIATSGLKG